MRHYPVYKRYFVRRLVVIFCGLMAQSKDPCSKITVSHHRENISALFVYVSHILGQSDKHRSKLPKGCVYDIDIRPTHRIFASKQTSYLVKFLVLSHWKDHCMNLCYVFNGDVNKSMFNFCQWINRRYGVHFIIIAPVQLFIRSYHININEGTTKVICLFVLSCTRWMI